MNAKDQILEFFRLRYPGWFYAVDVANLTGVSQGRTYQHIKALFNEGKLRVKAGKLSATRQPMTLYQAKLPEDV